MKIRLTPVGLVWLIIFLVGSGAMVAAFVAEKPVLTNADQVRQIADEFACPVCAGQSLAESDVPVARNIRITISNLVDEGVEKDQIRVMLIERFGTDIDYSPSGSGLVGMVWVLPIVAGIMGVCVLLVTVRRWQGSKLTLLANRRFYLLLVVGGAVLISVLTGIVIAGAIGSRKSNDALSGDIRSSTRNLLIEASVSSSEEAIAIYDQVLELQPSNVEALTYRGWAAWREGSEEQARMDFSDAVVLDPTYPDVRVFSAIQKLSESRPVDAAFDLMVLDELDAPPIVKDLLAASRLRERTANELSRSGEIVKALELLDSGLSLDTTNVSLIAERGWILATTGDASLVDLGVDYLNSAIALDPNHPYALSYRAVVFSKVLRRPILAEADLQVFRALKEKPDVLNSLLSDQGLLSSGNR